MVELDRLDDEFIEKLSAEDLTSEELFMCLFSEPDEIKRARIHNSLKARAKELKVTTFFNSLYKAYKKVDEELQKKAPSKGRGNYTEFTGPYKSMQCWGWIADDTGIYQINNNNGQAENSACYHPIIPIERLRNLETGEEQLKIAFKRNNKWEEVIVPKVIVSSASKIVNLSSRGIAVTSENAKSLVKFLADVENANEAFIKVEYSTSKLGWIKNGFMPYDTEITFDADAKFSQIVETVKPTGSRAKWYEHMCELRKSDRMEAKFMLAASFASVLVKPLNALPFFVDLWGETEGGKSVALMVAASVWADPDESAYIKDYKGTEVGLEAVCDLLNHLPLCLDDSSKKNRRLEENFEGLIYDLCSGKGKTRSNKDLGLNRESHWKNCILTNGERPLSSYVTQGGAMNRILEVECGRKLFNNPRLTAETVKATYGHAGKEFVDLVKAMNIEDIKQIQQGFMDILSSDEKMQKQSLSLSIVLTADKLATDYLFKDGQYLNIEQAKQVLINRNELSDNERCYQYLLDSITMNRAKFDDNSENIEKWGVIDGNYAIIISKVFNRLCDEGKFSRQSFLSWANLKGLLKTDKGRLDKDRRFGNIKQRCIYLDINPDTKVEGFQEMDKMDQMELPFK